MDQRSEVCTAVFGAGEMQSGRSLVQTVPPEMQVENPVAKGGTSFQFPVLSFCASVEVPAGAGSFREGSDRGVTMSKLPKIRSGRSWHRSWRWWVEED